MDWLDPLRAAVEEIEYKGWDFLVARDGEGAPYLQIQFEDPAMDPTLQRCRRWLLYPSMNRSEAVRTAWMAVLAAEEHEARERFTFRGRRIMTPHVDFDKVAERGVPVAVTTDP